MAKLWLSYGYFSISMKRNGDQSEETLVLLHFEFRRLASPMIPFQQEFNDE